MSIAMLADGDMAALYDGAAYAQVSGSRYTLFGWVRMFAPSDSDFRRMLTVGSAGNKLRVMMPGTPRERLEFHRKHSVAAGEWKTNNGTMLPTANRWQSWGIVYDESSTANTPALFIDGVSASVVVGVSPSGTLDALAASDAIYYGNITGAASSGVVNTAVSHTAVWNRLLTEPEMALVHKHGPLALPHGLLSYLPFDQTQIGGRYRPLRGSCKGASILTVAAPDLGDPYKGRYVGSRLWRRVSRSLRRPDPPFVGAAVPRPWFYA